MAGNPLSALAAKGRSLLSGGGEKRHFDLTHADSSDMLTSALRREPYNDDGMGEVTEDEYEDHESLEDGEIRDGDTSASRSEEKKLETVGDLKEAIDNEKGPESKIAMPDQLPQAAQINAISSAENKIEENDVINEKPQEEKQATKEEKGASIPTSPASEGKELEGKSDKPTTTIAGLFDDLEEKADEPVLPASLAAAKAEKRLREKPAMAKFASDGSRPAPSANMSSPTRRSTASSVVSDKGDVENMIFKTEPVIQNLDIKYSVDTFMVGHISFVADMRHEGHTWRVLFHRQNLVEYHGNLKSIRLQSRLGCLNPFSWCFGSPPPEDALPDSVFDREPSSLLKYTGSSTMRLLKRTLEDDIREIHFPRILLMTDRPHLIHRKRNLTAENPQLSSTLDELKKAVQKYLSAILASDLIRNLPSTIELFRCSSMSFDRTLGPSIIEGWVKFQKHPPSLRAVQWRTCRLGCIVCNCACLPISNSRRYTAWMVVKPSFVAFMRKPLDTNPPFYVLLFDSGFEVLKGFGTTGRKKHIYLHSNTVVADLTFNSRNEKRHWAQYFKLDSTVTSWHCKDHPFGSFADEREDGCFAKMLVDGRDYFAAVAEGLEQAQHSIYISGWWVTPDVPLKRNTKEGNDYWKLSSILLRKAAQGVKVHVLMFKEVEVAISLKSLFQESRIARHPNVYVLRHPNFTLTGEWFWSHHEKLVVCDGVKAFSGGLDLCWGRYDDESHSLIDTNSTWHGIDYYNPRIADIYDPRMIDNDILDRDRDPRMPWHDVAFTMTGPGARDLARHFIHQWNYAIDSRSGSRSNLPYLVPNDFPAFPDPAPDHIKVKCQVLRSLPAWSGGQDGNTEMSIQNAYLGAIADAEKYVYIENQFFVSGLQGDSQISNRIADALYARICRAAAEKKPFKVIIFIPLLPAFEGSVDDSGQAALRQTLYWQFRTISRGENRRSLLEKLEDNPDIQDPSNYITFFSLRTFEKNHTRSTDASPNVFTEMVYIHSKMMIVDDHVAFIGSANINDRSMSGQRDSELCVKFTDVVLHKDAKLGGEDWVLSGHFAKGLRMKLFEEHFGNGLSVEVLDDFILDKNFAQLKALARNNTDAYEKVFAPVPSNRILTFADLRRNRLGNTSEVVAQTEAERAAEENEEFGAADPAAPHEIPRAVGSSGQSKGFDSAKLQRIKSFSSLEPEVTTDISMRERMVLLNGVYGHVVDFPIKFLSRARKLKPNAGLLVQDQIFT